MIDVHRRGVSPHPITAEFMTGVPAEMVIREDKLVGHETNPKELERLRRERIPEIFDAATMFLPRSMSCRQAGKKCVSADTEVLTPGGWIRIDEFDPETDVLAQWQRGIITFEPSDGMHVEEAGNVLLQLSANHIDQLVTSEHKLLTANDRTEEAKIVTAAELNVSKSHWHMPTSGNYYNTEDSLLSDDAARLLAAIQADATIDAYDNLVFKLAKPRKLARLEKLLKKLQLRYSYTTRGFFVHNSNPLVVLLASLLGQKKLFGPYLLRLGRNALEAFIDEVPHWDGYAPKGQYFTTVRQNAEWVQTIAHLTGNRATFKRKDNTNGFGKKPLYWVRLSGRSRTSLVSINKEDHYEYEGYVYCPTVPSGFFLCRRNGKISVTGNSNHGLNYGMEADRFSLENLVPLADARPMVDAYHRAYPALRKRWYKQLQAQMKRNRMLENCFGRKIQFMGAFGNDLWNKVYAWLPQSTVADITIRGFCNFFADTRSWMRAAEPLAQVHDSIMFQYPESRGWKDMAACLVEVCHSEAMLRPWCEYHGERFQLGVEAKVGRAWGRDTMHEVELSLDVDEVARNLQAVVEGQAALAA